MCDTMQNKKTDFNDDETIARLKRLFDGYTYTAYKESLYERELYSMDLPNLIAGITKKRWWEDFIGGVKQKNVLEVGCGVNYIVPYWLEYENMVTAFDICQKRVDLLRTVIFEKLHLCVDKLNLFVEDVETMKLPQKYDIINVNNVLHHVSNIRKALVNIREHLNETGKVLIVEPNYYYPFRWLCETELFAPYNVMKKYCIKKGLMEEGEKGCVFKELKVMINDIGFTIEVYKKDVNYLGYALSKVIKNKKLMQGIYWLDRHCISKIVPRIFAPFEYFILTKK
jgi:SAM-dependent methyltransferase